MEALVNMTTRFEELGGQIKGLLDAPTAENLTKAEALLTEQEQVKSQIEAARTAVTRKAELEAKAKANADWGNQPATIGFTKIEAGEQEADRTKSFGNFLQCVVGACVGKTSTAKERLHKVYGSSFGIWKDVDTDQKDLLGQTGTTGGYLIPTQFYAQLMKFAAETALIRPGAMVLPMQSNSMLVPVLDQATAPTAGETAFFGGLKAAWVGEGQALTEQNATFRQANLTAHKLAGIVDVSSELLKYSGVSVEPLLYSLMGGAVAWYEDYAFLRGNAVGKPAGILNANALVQTAARGSATAISLANVAAMWVKMLPSLRSRAVWIVSQSAEPEIIKMAGAANSVFVPNGFVAGSGGAVQQSLNYQIFGRPVLVTEKMPALNTLGDCLLVDRGSYLIGDTGSIEIAASEHYQFGNDLVSFRFIHRVGGMPWASGAVTLSDASTTVSPFVALAVQ